MPFQFVCVTDNPKNLNSDIVIKYLPAGLKGWWCKPYIFSKSLNLEGTILYLDLDVVISGNIDKLFTYAPQNWCTIRDFTRAQRPDWQKYNSSVIKFRPEQLYFVWEDYARNGKEIQRKYWGDQDYLFVITQKSPANLYPDSWIQSWKWEIRKDKTLSPGPRGNRKLAKIENVTPPKDCCICVFHGDPNPHNCNDPWVVDNWK